MRSFTEWRIEALKGIIRSEIDEEQKTHLILLLDAVKNHRKIEHLNELMKRFQMLSLRELCPTAEEIQMWFEKGESGDWTRSDVLWKLS